MSEITLAIIFNHKYNGNIPKLYDMYCERFSKIIFIVPFYMRGELDEKEYNIIAVYESSYSFQGYIAQAMAQLGTIDSDHIMFIGDDLILNPEINENNYKDYFNLDKSTSFNAEICKINERFEKYVWNFDRIKTNLIRLSGDRFVNSKSELPSVEEAYNIAAQKGYTDFSFWNSPYYKSVGVDRLKVLAFIFKYSGKKFYPAFGGYSDFTIVSCEDLQIFVHYCGVLAAMGVFVEIAVPTAMVLACKKIKTMKDLPYSRGDMWGMELKADFAEEYNYSIQKLYDNWPQDKLYLHPIKLSQWRE